MKPSKNWLLFFPLLFALGACRAEALNSQGGTNGAGDSQLTALQAVSDLAVGPNRFAFALLGPDGREVIAAETDVRLYALQGDQAEPKGSFSASYQEMIAGQPHVHDDGEVHLHEDVRGVYVIPDLPLDAAGTWGIEVTARTGDSGGPHQALLSFTVSEQSYTPPIGSPAPASRTETADTPEELALVCSREPPEDMHGQSIHESLDAGRPFLAVFSTPSYCQSRLCGPVTEVVLSLRDRYENRMDFIHIEPFDLDLIRTEGTLSLSSTALEWGLPTEPWVFLVDEGGNISAKFEGVVGNKELESAIEAMLGGRAGTS